MAGCEKPNSKPDIDPKQKTTPTVSKSAMSKNLDSPADNKSGIMKDKGRHSSPASNIKQSSLGGDNSGPGRAAQTERALTAQQAVDQIYSIVDDSLSLSSTTVLWCIDSSNSAGPIVEDCKSGIVRGFAKRMNSTGANKLSTAMVFSQNDMPVLASDSLIQTVAELEQAFSKKPTGQNDEPTLQTLQAGLEKFKSVKTADRQELILVVITDEAPTDVDRLDAVIRELESIAVSCFVIGVPAPFGMTTVVTTPNDEPELKHGPETVQSEVIQVDFNASEGTMIIDSGFGAWAWERLCRKSNGRFLALRPNFQSGMQGAFVGRWPVPSARVFSVSAMQKYAPFVGSAEEYQAELKANAAKQALVAAAEMPRTPVLQTTFAEFSTGDDAALARDIDRVQREAARVTLPLTELMKLLKNGEADRAKLQGARWQAAFDLAYGRALAHLVRAEGFNAMLAKLKRGMAKTNPDSNAWRIESADEIESGGGDKRNAEIAKEYLNRVITEHPDTPWAFQAAAELNSPFGWKIVELKR
jgi:hypothetical protein